MATFTIDSENNITAHAGLPPTGAHEPFANLKDLTKLTGSWPISRLADVWNSFAGVAPFTDLKPVKKFTTRKDAVTRIWRAVERLAPLVAEPVPDVAPLKGKRNKGASKEKRRDTPRAAAKQTETAARAGSKTAMVLELLQRPSGATSKELMKVTGWQPHSVRGFLSGTIGKKMGLTVTSTKGEDGERSYSVKA